jgi:protein TonB
MNIAMSTHSRQSAMSLGIVLLLHTAVLYAVIRSTDFVAPSLSVPLSISFSTVDEPTLAKPKVTPRKPEPTPVPQAAVTPAPQPQPVAEKTPEEPASAPATVLTEKDVDYLNNPKPGYPRLSQRLGEHGKVMVRAYVNADGSVSQVSIQTGSGYARLDNAAKEVLERWKFRPRAAGAWVIVPFLFTLT